MKISYLVSYVIVKGKPKFGYILISKEPKLMETLCYIMEHENNYDLDIDNDIVILAVNQIKDDIDEYNEYIAKNNADNDEQSIEREDQNCIDSITVDKSGTK